MTLPPFDDGRYATTTLLKQGHHVRVYLAIDQRHNDPVVLKLFRNDIDEPLVAAAMFDRELAALEVLQHPNIVRKKRSFHTSHGPCLVLEYVPGETSLASRIATARRPTLEWRIGILRDVLTAVHYAHSQGVIHRDISLANMLLDTEENRVKLSDFGIAKLQRALEPTHYQTLRNFYTLPFAAPEQVRGHEPDTRSDLYAFGVAMVAVLSWTNLPATFELGQLDSALQPLTQELTQDTHRRISSVLRDTLDSNPNMRPDAHELQDALRRLAVEAKPTQSLVVRLSQKSQHLLQQADRTRAQIRDDLNQYLKGQYEPSLDLETGEESYMIRLYGQTVQLLLRPERRPHSPEGALFVSNLEWPEHDRLQARRVAADDLPFSVSISDSTAPSTSAQSLVDALYVKFREREDLKTAQAAREDFVRVPQAVVDFQKSQLKGLTVQYAVEGTRSGAKTLKLGRNQPFKVRLKGLKRSTAGDGAPTSPLGNPYSAQLFEQAFQADLEGRGIAFAPGTRRALARVESFDATSNLLHLSSFQRFALPLQGELQLIDPAASSSVNRQDAALSAFVQGAYHNPELARRLMIPQSNDLNEARPRVPLQPRLQANQENHRLLGRALAAEDLFLIQGPPGTGKTTFIVDLVGQLLRETPHARVLVTSQSNKAVDHVLSKLEELGEPWRSVRYASERWEERGAFPSYQQSFERWLDNTRSRCRDALTRYAPLPGEQGEDVLAVLNDWLNHIDTSTELEPDFLDGVSVFGATCATVGAMQRRFNLPMFDWVILDEAARATTAEALIPLLAARRCVMVGDHKQLPPFLEEVVADELERQGLSPEDAKRSLFEHLFGQFREQNRHSMRIQHRMHSSIAKLVGDVFYAELHGLETAGEDSDRPTETALFDSPNRVYWVDVEGTPDSEAVGHSSYNEEEITAVLHLLRQLSASRKPGSTQGVSIISPYAAQIRRIEQMIARERHTFAQIPREKIRVGTVDSFQGEEDDIVICSLVKIVGRARFVTDPNRLNVTFSRARSLLVIVGNYARARRHPLLSEVTHHSFIPADHVWPLHHLLNLEAVR